VDKVERSGGCQEIPGAGPEETGSTVGISMGPMEAKPGQATPQLTPFAGLSY